jgi:hypothetical protein
MSFWYPPNMLEIFYDMLRTFPRSLKQRIFELNFFKNNLSSKRTKTIEPSNAFSRSFENPCNRFAKR